jgi:hypothetical protein
MAIYLMPYIQKSNFTPFYTSNQTDFLSTDHCLLAFTGFEISAIPAEETKDKLIFGL